MNKSFEKIILESTNSTQLQEMEVIQNLWSGYGSIIRYGLNGSSFKTVVVKHVKLPKQASHPRGWNTDLSHKRKVKSYEVETAWYNTYSQYCDDGCRIPKCLALKNWGNEVLMVLEDLDSSGYARRATSVAMHEITACLKWLANFHAIFMHKVPKKLWEVGTYWHLNTRPDEWVALKDIPLKNAANKIDDILSSSPFLTLVHGDAKLANFCFSDDGNHVAAVDFQYVGGGCGMKDVAYFIGSCLYEEDCEKYEQELLETYFSALKLAIQKKGLHVETEKLEQNWRELYPLAWTDFHRFLKGWSPGHWKINSYSEKMERLVLKHVNS